MNSPRPVPGIRDSRTFQARWNGSVTSGRSVGRDPDALVVDRDLEPLSVDCRAQGHGPVRGPVLERVSDEVLKDLPDPRPVDLERWEVGRHLDDQAIGPAGGFQVAPQPADDRREQDRRTLEDQRVRLKVRHVEDLADQRGEALGDLIDPSEVLALLLGAEFEVQERLRVPPDQRQRRPQFVADGGNEPLAQLLERPDRADVAEDRGRPRPGLRVARLR